MEPKDKTQMKFYATSNFYLLLNPKSKNVTFYVTNVISEHYLFRCTINHGLSTQSDRSHISTFYFQSTRLSNTVFKLLTTADAKNHPAA